PTGAYVVRSPARFRTWATRSHGPVSVSPTSAYTYERWPGVGPVERDPFQCSTTAPTDELRMGAFGGSRMGSVGLISTVFSPPSPSTATPSGLMFSPPVPM